MFRSFFLEGNCTNYTKTLIRERDFDYKFTVY